MGSMHLDACWSKSSQQAAAGSFLSAGCVCVCVCVVVVVVCVLCVRLHTHAPANQRCCSRNARRWRRSAALSSPARSAHSESPPWAAVAAAWAPAIKFRQGMWEGGRGCGLSACRAYPWCQCRPHCFHSQQPDPTAPSTPTLTPKSHSNPTPLQGQMLPRPTCSRLQHALQRRSLHRPCQQRIQGCSCGAADAAGVGAGTRGAGGEGAAAAAGASWLIGGRRGGGTGGQLQAQAERLRVQDLTAQLGQGRPDLLMPPALAQHLRANHGGCDGQVTVK